MKTMTNEETTAIVSNIQAIANDLEMGLLETIMVLIMTNFGTTIWGLGGRSESMAVYLSKKKGTRVNHVYLEMSLYSLEKRGCVEASYSTESGLEWLATEKGLELAEKLRVSGAYMGCITPLVFRRCVRKDYEKGERARREEKKMQAIIDFENRFPF